MHTFKTTWRRNIGGVTVLTGDCGECGEVHSLFMVGNKQRDITKVPFTALRMAERLEEKLNKLIKKPETSDAQRDVQPEPSEAA